MSEMLNEVYITPDFMKQRYLPLRENEAESEEDWFQFGQKDSYTFYDVEGINSREMHISYYNGMPEVKDSVYQAIVFRDGLKVSH